MCLGRVHRMADSNLFIPLDQAAEILFEKHWALVAGEWLSLFPRSSVSRATNIIGISVHHKSDCKYVTDSRCVNRDRD